MTKMVTLGSLFTEAEFAAALKIWETDRDNFHRRVRDEIVTPVLPRIAKTTGQENDAGYLAYALEYVMMKPLH